MIIYILLLFTFLVLSAFFSGMEAAIFSISRFRVKTLISENRKGSVMLEKIKAKSGKTLASILLANLLVNIGASSIGAIILIRVITQYQFTPALSFVIEFIIMTSFLLIIGEITPKTIAISNAEFFALKFGNVINYLINIFNPISNLMEIITHKIILYKKGEESISDKEIKLMLSEAKKFKVLDEGEERFAYRILKFGKMKVNEIMTPRQKVVGVDIDADTDEAKKIVSLSKHSRICVFDKKGNVAGILYAKDLFIRQIIMKQSTIVRVETVMREPYVVPETKNIDNLLGEFRKNGIHMSVVVDEFGSFAGIVTLEDILESLFGEIIDEYDERDDLPYEKITLDTYLCEGEISIGELARLLNIEPFAEEGERLSGFILNHLGRIPKEHEKFNFGNLEVTVEEMHDRNIERVLIKKVM
jgi:putative hemolysin